MDRMEHNPGGPFETPPAPPVNPAAGPAPGPTAAQAGQTPPPEPPPGPQAAPPHGGPWTPPSPGSVPPPGSYPAQPPWPVPPQPEKKVRRVGVVTMALCLIAVGALLVVRVLAPNLLDFWLIARLSPLILVFLGVEMLIAVARHKDEKLRFDVLSVFVSLLLIGGSLMAAVVPEVIRREVEGNRVGNRLSAELEQQTVELLKAHSELPVYNVEWYVNVENNRYSDDMTVQDLRAEHYVQARVYMPGGYQEPAAFAKDCRAVLDLLQGQVPHMNYASLYGSKEGGTGYEGDVIFSLWVENQFLMDSDTARLADMTETNYWQGDHYSFEPAVTDYIPDDMDGQDEPDAPDDFDAPDAMADDPPEEDTSVSLLAARSMPAA